MSSIFSANSIINNPNSNMIGDIRDNSPSAEEVRHIIDNSNRNFSSQQGASLANRNAVPRSDVSREALLMVPAAIKDSKLKFSGAVVTYDDFINDPLFKDAEEKSVVFKKLFLLTTSSKFSVKYDEFLKSLSHNTWHELYKENPEELALFSIVAFYDGYIIRDELLTLNMASSLLAESTDLQSGIIDVKFRVVEDDKIEEYLGKSGFPPFAPDKEAYVISGPNRKQGDALNEAIIKFHSEYKKRDIIGKTFIEYTLLGFNSTKENRGTIEAGIYYLAKSKVGFKDVREGLEGTVVLAPPELITSLYYAASSVTFDPIPQHHFMFGFNKDPGPLFKGIRAFSVASVLFKLPFVHKYQIGPKAGVPAHDNFHLLLDAINKYLDFFVNLASRIEIHADENFSKGSTGFRWCKKICDSIIDREVNEYRELPRYEEELIEEGNSNPTESDIYGRATWSFIIYKVLKKAGIKLTNKIFLELLEKHLYPILDQVTSEHGLPCIPLDYLKETLEKIEKKRTPTR